MSSCDSALERGGGVCSVNRITHSCYRAILSHPFPRVITHEEAALKPTRLKTWRITDSPVYASLDHPLCGFAAKRVKEKKN